MNGLGDMLRRATDLMLAVMFAPVQPAARARLLVQAVAALYGLGFSHGYKAATEAQQRKLKDLMGG